MSSSTRLPTAVATSTGVDLDADHVDDIVVQASKWSAEIHNSGAGGSFDLRAVPVPRGDTLRNTFNSSRSNRSRSKGASFIGSATGPDTTVVGSAKADRIILGSGNDSVEAIEGNDFIDAGAGDDEVAGGGGSDRIYGGDGDDALVGSTDSWYGPPYPGVDRLYGGNGADAIKGTVYAFGGNGNDVIFSGALVDAGPGNDVVAASPRRVNCGSGIDRAIMAKPRLRPARCERQLTNNNDGEQFHTKWHPGRYGRLRWCAATHLHVEDYEPCATSPRPTKATVWTTRPPSISGNTHVGGTVSSTAPTGSASDPAFAGWDRCTTELDLCSPLDDSLVHSVSEADIGSRLRAHWTLADGTPSFSASTRVITSSVPIAGAAPEISDLNIFGPFTHFQYEDLVAANWTGPPGTRIERRSATPYEGPTPWRDDVPVPASTPTSLVHLGGFGTTTCVRAVSPDDRTSESGHCLTRPLTTRAFTSVHGGWSHKRSDEMYDNWYLSGHPGKGSARTGRITASKVTVYAYQCTTCDTLEFRWNGKLIKRQTTRGPGLSWRMLEIPVANFGQNQTGVLEVRKLGKQDDAMLFGILAERLLD